MAPVQQMWAPWRGEYVTQPVDGCPLCTNQPRSDEDAYVVARGEHVYAMLNLYPYNPGHIMVMPLRHVAGLDELTLDESAEAQRFLERSIRALRVAFPGGPHGFNVGLNLGSAAGAGIPDHLHWQLLPRWNGDTNFMPALADVRVMPEHMVTTWRKVRDAWQAEDEERGQNDGV